MIGMVAELKRVNHPKKKIAMTVLVARHRWQVCIDPIFEASLAAEISRSYAFKDNS